MAGRALALTVALVALSCSHEQPAPPLTAAPVDPLAPLRSFEQAQRAEAHFLTAPPSDRTCGADPYDLVALPDGSIAGILRGRDALVLFDEALNEKARIALPRSPSAIAANGRDVYVTSEIEPVIAHVRDGARLPDIPLEGVTGARAIAAGADGTLFVVEEHDDRLITLRAGQRTERRVGRTPIRIARANGETYVLSLVEHSITAYPSEAKVAIDGPFWSLDAAKVEGGTLLVAGGVEDHPLDRTGGFFGYVDSFVYVFFHPNGAKEMTRVAAINASELGVVVPKAVAFSRDKRAALVAAYGSAKALRLTWPNGVKAAPAVTVIDALPGASALVATPNGFVAANPLLDAWVNDTRVAHVLDTEDKRSERTKLGEALFFTDLMAPANKSDGALSRFTCETCHFEGYGDGRIHHTGRGDVKVTTKPLLGLFNNRPHFSRALDPDLSAVAENEFRVAGAHSGTDPHFSVDGAKTKWLSELRLANATFEQEELRIALMSFLMDWNHRTNPRAIGRKAFTDEERKGAVLFRDRCEGCHQARAAADDKASRVSFDRWESLVLSDPDPIVWAKDEYAKTGVVPYVNEQGARVPSLRRLYKKGLYLTTGSARDLETLLSRARWNGDTFTHDGTTEGVALDPAAQKQVRAFLDLL